MEYITTEQGPRTLVQLKHPAYLPDYQKLHQLEHHPQEGPPLVILSGGSGARALSETLIRYTHNSIHILPMFDDGGSSRELREKLGMPPPGDLRNRLLALSDLAQVESNSGIHHLLKTRLPLEGTPRALQEELDSYLHGSHPHFKNIESRYRRIIIKHLDCFNRAKPTDFDLRGGCLGNFVIAGCYLSVGNWESVIFEISALAKVHGQVHPVCVEGDYHLKAAFQDQSQWIGQSRITSCPHPPIRQLQIVTQNDEQWIEAQPRLNPLAEGALRQASLITFATGSFYTSIISNLLVTEMGQVIRESKCPKVVVANLLQDIETPGMTVSGMLQELYRYLCLSDSHPGKITDYIHYVVVGTHGETPPDGRVPIDLSMIQQLGVEPIILPVEKQTSDGIRHNAEVVAAVLLSLC